jgi:hypothetical protein
MVMKKILITLCLGLAGDMVFSQQQPQQQPYFAPGYIVTTKGDTVKGEVKVNTKNEFEVYEKIAFKDPSGAQKNYKPNKIKGYGVKDQHYVSMIADGEPRFYQLLVRGDISLYKMIFEAMRMNELSYDAEYYIAKPDSKKLVVVKENKFKKQMTEWMKDNLELLSGYEDTKEFDQEKAVALINQYNSWKAGQQQ